MHFNRNIVPNKFLLKSPRENNNYKMHFSKKAKKNWFTCSKLQNVFIRIRVIINDLQSNLGVILYLVKRIEKKSYHIS
jgi:hypothetical protein